MATNASTVAQSPTARGQQHWFFGMLAEVKASAADTGGQYTLLEITAPAGLQTPLHVHYREDEGFYVLDGAVTIQLGEETVELGPGQHAFGPRDIPHRFTIGPDGARMIWVLAGRLRGLRRRGERAGRDADRPPAERRAARERRRDRPPPRHGAAAGLSRTGQAASATGAAGAPHRAQARSGLRTRREPRLAYR
jgi:mannose-6-phosphate isomerase-like protein (cupin superfamily)